MSAQRWFPFGLTPALSIGLLCADVPSAIPVPDSTGMTPAVIAQLVLVPDTLQTNTPPATRSVEAFPVEADGDTLFGLNIPFVIRDTGVASIIQRRTCSKGVGLRCADIRLKQAGTTVVQVTKDGRSDSTWIVVGTPAPTLTQIVVTPPTATLDTGATQQFAAYGRLSNGDSVATTVTWTATGGTIGTGGSYKAGALAGAYRVIGSHATGPADTSAVTINEPPPPTENVVRGCPDSGYTRLVNVSTAAGLGTALTNAQPGDQIRLAGGTYFRSTAFRFDKSGTAGNPITICGMPGVMPLLKGTNDMLRITGAYQLVTGLVFEGAATSNSTNVVIISGTHHVTFTGNECRKGWADACLSLADWRDITVSYNYIHDSGTDESTDHCIYAKKTTGGGNKIINNLIYRCKARGISMHYNQATSQADGVLDVLVAHNTIVYNGSQGIKLHQGDRDTVVNNLVAFNGDLNNQSQINVEVAGVGHGTHSVIKNNLTWSPTASRAGIEDEVGVIKSGNVVADPKLVSATDWHLQGSSPAAGLGLPASSQSPDYDGVTRGTPPDAGAYEVVP